MSSLNKTRALLTGALIVSALIAPWYVSIIPMIVLALRWRAWEIVAVGLLIDLLWMPAPLTIVSALPLATCFAFFLVIVFEPLRRNLLLGA